MWDIVRYLYRRFPCFLLVRGTSVEWHADDKSPVRGEYPICMDPPLRISMSRLPTKAKTKLEETDWTDVKAKKGVDSATTYSLQKWQVRITARIPTDDPNLPHPCGTYDD
jgi:hypothetical protein